MTGSQGVGASSNFDEQIGDLSPGALIGSGSWQVNNSYLYLFGGSSIGNNVYCKLRFQSLKLIFNCQ
jgi:hypothetical protein